MTHKELIEAQRKQFDRFRDWLKYWCTGHIEMQHIEYDSRRKKFFYGNSSYMDLGELLRQNEGLESSPCMIYDTDVHIKRTQGDRQTLIKQHRFYICVLADTQIDGNEVTRAKDRCEELAIELLGWFDACKLQAPKYLRGYEMDNIDSTAPFLNGWEAVGMQAAEPLRIPCVDERRYCFEL